MTFWPGRGSDARGILCMVVGWVGGCVLGARAWLAWQGSAHGMERSFGLGVIAAGILSAGLDATWRLAAGKQERASTWSEVAFHPTAGGHIDGWPAWLVCCIVSAVAVMMTQAS